MKNLIGKTINQYQILLKVRETGTRVLYKVFDTGTKRNLALEIIKIDENIDYSELFDLLNKQAIQNAKLSQSNIAISIDSGIFDNIPYFVYNFSPLQPLRRLFNQKYSWRESSQALVAITQAISYAHEFGIVHGALNPNNVILDENRVPYLFGFGFEPIIIKYIASHFPGNWISNTDFAYCSPEQLIGMNVDSRSDIYSMGLILYEWLTGDILLLEETTLATLYKRNNPDEKVLDFKAIVMPEIRAIIQKCIAINPDDRYQTMQELSILLARGALDIKITPKMVDKPTAIPVKAVSPKRWIAGLVLIIIIILTVPIMAFWGVNGTRLTIPGLHSATPLANVTVEPTATLTLAAINTLAPTPTVTPRAKPTQEPNRISYPVLNGTALPSSLVKISPENAVRLVTLSRWGIGELNSLALSPDGTLLAAASPVGVYIFVNNELVLEKFLDTSSWVSTVEFSGDGKMIAAGDRDGVITVWDTSSWQKINHYSGHKTGILRLVFSPDDINLVSIAADNQLIKWSQSSNPISINVKDVTSLAYSQDGEKIITGGNDFKINVWDAKNLSLLKTFTHSSKVVDIKIGSGSNNVIVGGSDRSVTPIDLDTSEKLKPFTGMQNYLSRVSVSPDGSEIVASDIYGGIVAWDKNGTQLWQAPTRVDGFTPSNNVLGTNHNVAFSADGKTVISGLRNGTIRTYDALSGQEIYQSDTLNNHAERLVVSHNGKYVLSQNSNGKVRMWSLLNGKILFQVVGAMKSGSVFSLDDQYFAVASNKSTVTVFKTTTGDEVFKFKGLQDIQVVQFVQNDRFLAIGSDPLVRLWSMTSGQEVKTRTSLDGSGCTAIGDLQGTQLIRITKYDYVPADYGSSSFCAFQKVEWMKAISINETNKYITYGGNSKLGFTGPDSISKEMDDVNLRIIEKVALNTDKTLLAVAFDDHTIGIWNTNTKKMIMQFYGPDGSITDLQFTPDGKLLLSSSLDGTIRIWGIP
jgi:WD40 repeat protein